MDAFTPAVVSYLVTLTATPTPIGTLISESAPAPAFVELHIQADGANGAAAYVGGAELTTSTGYYLGIPAASVPGAALVLRAPGRMLYLSQIYAVGTAGNKLRVLGVPYSA